MGKLPDARYAALDAQYAKEQDELAGEIADLNRVITGYEQGKKDALRAKDYEEGRVCYRFQSSHTRAAESEHTGLTALRRNRQKVKQKKTSITPRRGSNAGFHLWLTDQSL